jgi:hypothetical protein
MFSLFTPAYSKSVVTPRQIIAWVHSTQVMIGYGKEIAIARAGFDI